MNIQHFRVRVDAMREGEHQAYPDWAWFPASQEELDRLIARCNHEPAQVRRRTDWYGDYLASPEWRGRRLVVLVLARGKCCRCDAEASQVHHLTYERIRREWLVDLEPLCDGCHETEHRGDQIRKAVKNILSGTDPERARRRRRRWEGTFR